MLIETNHINIFCEINDLMTHICGVTTTNSFGPNKVFPKVSVLGYHGDNTVSEEHAWDEIWDMWCVKKRKKFKVNITCCEQCL